MEKEKIIMGVRSVLSNNFSDEITENTHLKNDLGFDSIDMTFMAVELEVKFGIILEESDYERISTVSSLINIIEEKVNAKG